MTAVEFSPQERATLARIEAAEPAPESLRERVAVAICESDSETHGVSWGELDSYEQGTYRRLADAALAVIAGDR